MNRNPKISIIVPVYNVEKYLDRCIKSILNQTYKDFELILINDGSTDNSGNICDEYKKIDNRIVVIHKKNGGTSSARNDGIDIAKGKYIGFVDSDDYIEENMYYELYNDIKINNSDISICKYIEMDDNTIKHRGNLLKNSYSKIESLEELYKQNWAEFVVPWNKLYKSELIKEFRYPLGRKYEDAFIIHRLLYKCNKVTCINKNLYYYYQRKGSTMNSEFSVKNIDMLYFNLDRIKFFEDINQNELKHKSIYIFILNYFSIYENVKNILKDKYYLKKLKKLLIKNYKYIWISNKFNIKEKIAIIVFILNENYYLRIKNKYKSRSNYERNNTNNK